MSFSDPVKIKIGATEYELPRTSVGKNESEYTGNEGDLVVKAASAYGKRTRRTLRVDQTKITADPFIPANNTSVSMSNYIVFDLPPAGFTPAEALAVYKGFIETLQASSSKLVVQLLGGES